MCYNENYKRERKKLLSEILILFGQYIEMFNKINSDIELTSLIWLE